MGCSGKGCGQDKTGCGSGCGHGCSSAVTTEGINTISELKVYYSMPAGKEKEAYAFEYLHCITNVQIEKKVITGLEGVWFDSLPKMQEQILIQLKHDLDLSDEWADNVDLYFLTIEPDLSVQVGGTI